MNCPTCKKRVLAIMRTWGSRRKRTLLEIHHEEDAQRWNLGAATRVCKVRVSFEESQILMGKL